MKALIIAAGEGSRLKPFYSPKPLTPLLGLSLLEHVILRAKEAGITDFVIVVGHQAEKIIKKLGPGEKYGVKIDYVYNSDWKKGNGASVYAARDKIKEPFLLLMSDHLFDEKILQKLNSFYPNGQCYLCIDRNIQGQHINPEDATKVSLNHEPTIIDLGKNLSEYKAIDTGIFLCSPIIFSALKKSIARGDYTLTGGARLLAQQGKLKAIDITGHFWIDVDDVTALRKAKKMLLANLDKATDGPISRLINRKISRFITTWLCKWRLHPNTITILSFILAVAASALFFLGKKELILAGGILTQLASIIDGCDGEIARLQFKKTKFGELLDRTLDRYADAFIIIGLTHAVFLALGNEWVWVIGLIALLGSFMNSYTALHYDKIILLRQTKNQTSFRFGRDIRLFIIFLAALINQLSLALIILAVITNVESIRRLVILSHEYQSV
ncbi:MAG: NTP transferase domain-containing protein [Candidatus Aminicenantes bacterium]|nr:NTP transferase domain-containing protein [Candidatus Aminicenantes bacterium]